MISLKNKVGHLIPAEGDLCLIADAHSLKLFFSALKDAKHEQNSTLHVRYEFVGRPYGQGDGRQIQGTGPQLGSIFVVAADGSNILTTRAFPAPEVNFGDRDYYLAQKDRDAGFFVGGALIGKISAAPIFNFSIRRSTEDGHFNGVIGSSAFVDYFQNFYATVGDAADEFAVALLRADGDMLVRYPKFQAGQHLDLQLLRPELIQGRQVQFATSPIDGRARLYATAKVGSFPIYVAYSITRDAIIRKWAAGLIVPGGTGIVITTALLLLTLFALQRARREGWAVEQSRPQLYR